MDPLSITASAIALLGAVATTYDTIDKISGLPKAFDVVKKDLPLVQEILKAARTRLETTSPSSDDKSSVVSTLKQCESKAKELNRIFDELESRCRKHPDARTWDKVYGWYLQALKGTKAHKVERLMKAILGYMDNLATHQIFTGLATQEDMENIMNAINELSEVEPSVDDSELETGGIHASQTVTGDNAQQNNTVGGTHTFNTGNIFHGQIGTLNFGKGA